MYETLVPQLFKSVTGIHNVTTTMKKYIVQKLFPSNLIDFLPDGRSFTILEIMATTIIMCHIKMKKKYTTTNPIVYKVDKLFENDPNLSTKQLQHLSTQIKEGFLNNNNATMIIKKSSEIIDTLNHNSSFTANVDHTMTTLVLMIGDQSLKYDNLCTKNNLMRHQVKNYLQQSCSTQRSSLRK